MAEEIKCIVCGKPLPEPKGYNVCDSCYDSEIKCPVCGKYTFEAWGDFDVCEVCNWENDPIQYYKPDYPGGANHMSLNEARQAYREGRQVK